MAWCIAPVVEDLAEVCAIDFAVEIDVGGGVEAHVCSADHNPVSKARGLASISNAVGQSVVVSGAPARFDFSIGPCPKHPVAKGLRMCDRLIPNNRRLRRNLRRRCSDDSRNVRRTGFGSWHHAVDDWVRGEAKSKYA